MKSRLAVLVMVMMVSLAAAPARAGRPQMDPKKIQEAVPKYERFVKAFGYRPDEFQTYAVGQSHIDAAWKWRLAQTHKKVNVTFSHALDAMDREPDFVFAQSQPALYEWYKDDHPDQWKRLLAAVKRGQWEPVGGSWVEPDGNMPDGEAFVRQRLLGQRFYLDHFGMMTNIEWMPDSFGYNRNMPQIVARSGGKYIWCKKLVKNFRDMFPFHAFHWRGPDGSQLIASLCPNTAGDNFFPFQEVFPFGKLRYLLKPGTRLVANYTTPRSEIRKATSKDKFLMIGDFYGEGDGGNGPQDVEIEIQKAMRAKGYVKFTHAQNFFDDLALLGDRLPVWDDELYLETHRGTLTTQGWIKRANRAAEGMMRTLEPLSAFLSRFGESYPADALKSLWKLICLNQFHDILPGSSIPEVYDDARQDFASISKTQQDLLSSGLSALARKLEIEPAAGAKPVLVYNPLGFRRSDNVTVAAPAGVWHAVDGQGRALVSQAVSGGIMFRAEDLPALGWRVYYLAPGEGPKESGVRLTEDRLTYTLSNQFVRVRICKARGLIVSLIDLRTGNEVMGPTGGNRIVSFFDHHYEYQAWDISPWYKLNPILVPELAKVSVSMRGPLAVEVLVRREMRDRGEKTVFEQRVRLIDGDPLVHLDFDSDYHLKDSLTKLQFDTSIKPRVVVADGAYAPIARSTHPKHGLDDSRWEMSCQKWLDISDGRQGLAILNNGKYGFSYLGGGSILRQTMIKGATYPDADSAAENAAQYKWHELPFTDQGQHHIELALLPHPGDWRAANLWLAGYAFNTPLQAVMAEAAGGELPAEGSFLSIDSATSYIGIVKRAEDDDDLVVRLVEGSGAADRAVIRPGLGMKIEAAVETDLLEFNPKPLAPADGAVEVGLLPFEIKTVKIKLSR